MYLIVSYQIVRVQMHQKRPLVTGRGLICSGLDICTQCSGVGVKCGEGHGGRFELYGYPCVGDCVKCGTSRNIAGYRCDVSYCQKSWNVCLNCGCIQNSGLISICGNCSTSPNHPQVMCTHGVVFGHEHCEHGFDR